MGDILYTFFVKYPFLPVYLATVVLSVWRYPRYFDTFLRFLPIFFMFTLVAEISGVVTYEFEDFSIFLNELFTYYNRLIYNVYFIVFCGYFCFVFYRAIPWQAVRIAILAGSVLLALTALINPLYQSFQYEVQLGTYIAGSLVLIFSAGCYLTYRRSVSGRRYTDRDLLSWISLGVILFYSGFIPIIIIQHSHAITETVNPAVNRILQFLNFVLYGCFLAGLWRMHRQRVFLNQ